MFKKNEKMGKKRSSGDLPRDIPLSNSSESLIDKIKTNKKQYELTDVGVPLTSRFWSSKDSRRPLKDKNTGKLATILEDISEEDTPKIEFVPL